MTTLNFNGPVVDLLGKNLGSETLKGLLSQLLISSTVKGDISEKYFLWAMNLTNSGQLVVDDVDKKTLRSFVSEYENLTVLARCRLLEVFDGKDPAITTVEVTKEEVKPTTPTVKDNLVN